MKNLKQCIINCEMIADFFNNIIKQSGRIELDNKTIWQGFLHKPEVDNEFWAEVITGLEALREHAPDAFSTSNKSQLWDAKSAFDQYRDRHPRVLDTKQDGVSLKGHAWKLCMTCREVINRINGIDLPNSDESKIKEAA